MNIKRFDVSVIARVDGDQSVAQLLCCDSEQCVNAGPDVPSTFIAYEIDGNLHLQCNACTETYCAHKGVCNLSTREDHV